MQQFTVPQFIEREAKIVGPLTFKQLIVLGSASALCIAFYFLLPFFVFILGTLFFVGGSAALMFVRINKTPLFLIIKNLIVFVFRPKMYFWKKKTAPPVLKIKPQKARQPEKKEGSELKIAKKSRLKKIADKIKS